MAKKAMLEREKKRKKLVLKYLEKRQIFLKELKQANSLDDIFKINEKIQKLPRNSSRIRFKKPLLEDWSPTWVFSFFGLCRNALRELANDCFLPGITKASW
jgi:small subunit ribosomal protein S14